MYYRVRLMSCWVLAIAALMVASSGCSRAEPCVQRTSDGAWTAVGLPPPPLAEVKSHFERGGTQALSKRFGNSISPEGSAQTWVFEARSESQAQTCNPPHMKVSHSQSFTVVRVTEGPELELTCTFEVREFIGDRLISVEDALRTKPSPLSTGPASCGRRKKRLEKIESPFSQRNVTSGDGLN